MAALRSLIAVFEQNLAKNPKTAGLKRHESRPPRDYVTNPKPDGYRSVHYVFTYRTNTPHLRCFDGHLIEVQIRTRLQHAWATAVEIVDTFTGQSLKTALKTQIGDLQWRRFFALMGSAIARREKSPLVPNTPASPDELKRELRDLAMKLDVERILSGLGDAVKKLGDEPAPNAEAYILELNSRERSITVTSYTALGLAQEAYLAAEKRSQADPAIQVVQVSVEDIAALRTAYPNYYLDTGEFIKALRQAIR